jgi:hypothetical protein
MLNFETEPQHKAEALEVISTILPKIKSIDGCENIMLLTQGDQKFGLLGIWKSREHADAALGVIGPQLLPVVNKLAKGPATPVLYDVHTSL